MPHLTLLEKGTQKPHRVDNADAVVGRDPACTIYVDGDAAKTVSGRHARFFLSEGRWFVEDAGSRNGTYVGTRKLDPGTRHPIKSGDIIGLGLTGTQLVVQEAVGRNLAATMIEAPSETGTDPVLPSLDSRKAEVRSTNTALPTIDPGKEVRLVISTGRGQIRLMAQNDRVTVGRALECLIRIEGEAATSVSRLHAEIVSMGGHPTIRDTASRHGTYLNGKKIEGPQPLKRGDQVTFGPIGQTFMVEEAAVVASGSTPTMPRASAAIRTSNETFESELPTPPLPRDASPEAIAAARRPSPPPRPSPTPRKSPTPRPGTRPASPPKPMPVVPVITARDKSSNTRVVVGVIAAIVILAVVGFIAYTKGQSSRGDIDLAQQATAVDSVELARANLDAAVAKAAFDSATVAAGQNPDSTTRATLDSLHRASDDANERVKKAGGHDR